MKKISSKKILDLTADLLVQYDIWLQMGQRQSLGGERIVPSSQ